MAVCEILSAVKDHRKDSDDCVYNGYLEDYLAQDNELDGRMRDAFNAILEKNVTARICVGLRDSVSREAVSNQIIRYKDVFKLEGSPIIYPYIIYMDRGEEERALLVVPYEKYSFIYAKGYYLCMTEPAARFIDAKNEIVAISSNEAGAIADTFERMFHEKCGAIQRSIDRHFFAGYDELKELAMAAGEEQKDSCIDELRNLEDRSDRIRQYVINWFLLKKVLYVQYMINKSILKERHEGNVRRQRNQAKQNADAILFRSYSEMWRVGTELEGNTSTQTLQGA